MTIDSPTGVMLKLGMIASIDHQMFLGPSPHFSQAFYCGTYEKSRLAPSTFRLVVRGGDSLQLLQDIV